MNNLIQFLHQVSQTEHPTIKALANFFIAAITWFCTALGVLNETFFRVFQPETWTMQDIASLVAVPASIMYFLKLKTERQIAKRQLKKMMKEDGENE